jgi:hypothetical protein
LAGPAAEVARQFEPVDLWDVNPLEDRREVRREDEPVGTRRLDGAFAHPLQLSGQQPITKEVTVTVRRGALAGFVHVALLALFMAALVTVALFTVGCGPRAENSGEADSGVPASGDSSANADPFANETTPAPRGAGKSMAGTWTGTLRAETGEELPAVFSVAASGNPIYDYQTKGGARAVELTAVGQSLRFVPADGGVANVVVESLAVSPQRIAFSLSLSAERTSAYGSEATLSQSRGKVATEANLAGADLDVKMTISSETTFSQPNEVVPGEVQTVVCRGRLKRQ